MRRPTAQKVGVGLSGAAFVLLAALSGCTSGGEGGEQAVFVHPSSEIDVDVGIVLDGVVMTDELLPIVGAQVAVEGRPTVVTGDDGSFAVGGLEAGEHLVRIDALGFHSFERTVELTEGSNPRAEFVLNRIDVPKPYTEVVILRGYSICDVSLFLTITTIDTLVGFCPLGNPNRTVVVNVSADWQYAVIEMDWQALESFALYTHNDQNCVTGDPCYGAVMGRSPLRLEAAPNDTALAERYAPYGPPAYTGAPKPYPPGPFDLYVNTLYAGAFQREMNSTFNDVCDEGAGINFGCPGIGANAAGIIFTVYTSIFHLERPVEPQWYSARLD